MRRRPAQRGDGHDPIGARVHTGSRRASKAKDRTKLIVSCPVCFGSALVNSDTLTDYYGVKQSQFTKPTPEPPR